MKTTYKGVSLGNKDGDKTSKEWWKGDVLDKLILTRKQALLELYNSFPKKHQNEMLENVLQLDDYKICEVAKELYQKYPKIYTQKRGAFKNFMTHKRNGNIIESKNLKYDLILFIMEYYKNKKGEK